VKLSEIGEEALIERIIKANNLPKSAPGLVLGAGDDCAVLSQDEHGMFVLLTTDMLTEEIDFRLDLISPYQIGWKSVAVNLSDIAAMGGEPTWTFPSLGFRPDTEIEFVDEIFRGMTECAARYGSQIAGGDMNSVVGEMILSLTQLGKVEPEFLALRSNARIGDRILVTGQLGDSRGGLELLLKYGLDEANRLSAPLVKAHLMPVPRILEARAAVSTEFVNAMMDLSDGLGSDLPKLCKASRVGALIYSDKIPVSPDLRAAAAQLGLDALEHAASGGEDFELLMTVRPEHVDKVIEVVHSKTSTMVSEIGEIIEGSEVELISPQGDKHKLSIGWQHFI